MKGTMESPDRRESKWEHSGSTLQFEESSDLNFHEAADCCEEVRILVTEDGKGGHVDDQDYQSHAQMPAQDKVHRLFDQIDTRGTGRICLRDLRTFFTNSLKRRKIEMPPHVIARAADSLMFLMEDRSDASDHNLNNLTDVDSRGAVNSSCAREKRKRRTRHVLDRNEFTTMFETHSDLWQVLDRPISHTDKGDSAIPAKRTAELVGFAPKHKGSKHFLERLLDYTRFLWMIAQPGLIWIVLYVIFFLYCVVQTAQDWRAHDEAVQVFGNCVVVARASAKAINFHAALVLLPVSRHLITWTRQKSHWRHVLLPLDALQNAHVFLGIVLCLFTAMHVLAHICDYSRFFNSDYDDLLALLDDRIDQDELPPTQARGRLGWALGQRATWTGFLMLLCMIPALVVLRKRKQHFNRFWLLHQLLLVMLVLLCIHGTSNLLEHFQTVYWIAVPLSLYAIPRVYRELKCNSVTVLSATVHMDCKVLDLRIQQPSSWKSIQKPGMYAMLNVPVISRWEWHPFTISTAPPTGSTTRQDSAPHGNDDDSVVGFHIQAVGDWTAKLHALVLELQRQGPRSSSLDGLRIRMEGPIGAPSQAYKDYPVIVLIGAGIGVTPMTSVVRSLLQKPGKVRKVFFYWTKREANSSVFHDLMQEIYHSDKNNINASSRAAFHTKETVPDVENDVPNQNHSLVEIRHFCTGAAPDRGNLGDVLFHYAANAVHASSDSLDIFQGYRTHHGQVGVGRPNWKNELDNVVRTAKLLGERQCGVFLCGPERMAADVQVECLAVSKRDPAFHVHFSKEVF